MSASLTGGLTAGFNYQIPGSSIVFGFETEFGALRLKGSSSFAPVSSFSFAPNLVASTTIGPWYNATTGRIGWAWDRLMFYGKGGFSASTIESTIVDPVGGLGPGTGRRDVLGWAWGAGFEYVFAPKWSIKVEYLGLGYWHPPGGRYFLRQHHNRDCSHGQNRDQLSLECWPRIRAVLIPVEGEPRFS